MGSFFRDLKDPWKLLVVALVTANLIAVVAVFLMYQNKKAARAALKEVVARIDPSSKKASMFEDIKQLNEMRVLTDMSGLEGTDQYQVEDFIRKSATNANLSVQKITYQSNTGTQKGTVDYKYTVTFATGEEGVNRKNLAYFLYNIKVRTPQIKIMSISSGSSSTNPEKADKWRPVIEFVLSKEEDTAA